MRLLFDLESRVDAAYNPEYHHKTRGVLWNALEATEFEDWHGKQDRLPFCFSNPYPVRDFEEGETSHLLVSSPHPELLETMADALEVGSEFNIGDIGMDVSRTRFVETDVGEPGTRGVLRTDTGVYAPIPESRWDEFNISPDVRGDSAAWTPNMPVDVFLQRVRENLDWKRQQVLPQYVNPVGSWETLFEKSVPQKTYSVSIPVTSDSEERYEFEFVVSKWKFEYTVRNQDHRRWLNLLLDTGIGTRNTLGFGFVNLEVNDE